jgi:hypothetical protein
VTTIVVLSQAKNLHLAGEMTTAPGKRPGPSYFTVVEVRVLRCAQDDSD